MWRSIVLSTLCLMSWYSPGVVFSACSVLSPSGDNGWSLSHVWPLVITNSSALCFSHSSLFRLGSGMEILSLSLSPPPPPLPSPPSNMPCYFSLRMACKFCHLRCQIRASLSKQDSKLQDFSILLFFLHKSWTVRARGHLQPEVGGQRVDMFWSSLRQLI